MDERPLLVIMHDPPEVLASPDPRTGKLELHNTWLVRDPGTVSPAQKSTDRSKADSVKSYVSEAVKNGFAVIDVNLPKHITEDDVRSPRAYNRPSPRSPFIRANSHSQDEQDHEASDLLAKRCVEATELLNYLWDNYIELANSTHLFLLGTNVGHIAITQWIKTHETAAMERVDRTIHFIEDVDLQACRSTTNDMLAPWYYRTSMIYLSSSHNFWSSVFATTKPKKKFGFFIKRANLGTAEHISDMLLEQRDEVMEALLEETKEWRNSRPFNVTDDDEDGIVGGSEAMEISEPDPLPGATSSFKKLPPVGNFALSPVPRSSPAGPGSRTPSARSPTRGSAAR
jgi:histone deacetylase 6